MELALRLAGISYPYFTRVDEWTGFSLRPGAAGWQRDEGEAYVRINEHGMRDHDHEKTKPANTLRIAVLGDSYTEARQVDVNDTFAAVLERTLSSAPPSSCPILNNKSIEVLNFGVSGFSIAQELLHMRHRVWEFHPDIVILQITTGNDIRNNSWALEKSDQKPYFRINKTKSGTRNDLESDVKNESGTGLTLDLSFRNTSFYRSQTSLKSRLLFGIIQHSRVLQVLNRARTALRQQPQESKKIESDESAVSANSDAALGTEAGLDNAIYQPPSIPEWQEAWRITEQLLTMIRDEAAAHNTPLMFLIGTNAIQVDPDSTAQQAFLAQLDGQVGSGTELLYPDHRLAAHARSIDVPTLTLAEPMQRLAREQNLNFHGFPNSGLKSGHWNEEGHRAAGRLAADFVCQQL